MLAATSMGFVTGSCISPSLSDERGMSSFISLSGIKRHKERERSLANAQRRQSMQLERTLHALDMQYQRELAGVQGVQQELRRTLDRLGGQSAVNRPTLTLPSTSPTSLSSPNQPKQAPLQSCCPNHIVCSSCNLRLRLADTLTRRFTPSLWTMYTSPVTSFHSGETFKVYYMPRFVQQRSLSISDNSLRYLPFL